MVLYKNYFDGEQKDSRRLSIFRFTISWLKWELTRDNMWTDRGELVPRIFCNSRTRKSISETTYASLILFIPNDQWPIDFSSMLSLSIDMLILNRYQENASFCRIILGHGM